MGELTVIGGKAGGFNLKSVPGNITRPIMAKVKKAVFDIATPYVYDSSWLDCFAGTGSVGIEALSRGASFVRFVDIHPAAIQTIHENLEHTGLEDGAQVWHANVFQVLDREPDRRFDFIYVAPPQYERLWVKTLEVLDRNTGWMYYDTWVFVQVDPVEYEALSLQNLKLFDRREYGSTALLLFTPNFEQRENEG
ncbi:MAG: 16S rRNA (guanine(966)-N(2))-methyltransferase RsmD [Anaerolineales bacterium]